MTDTPVSRLREAVKHRFSSLARPAGLVVVDRADLIAVLDLVEDVPPAPFLINMSEVSEEEMQEWRDRFEAEVATGTYTWKSLPPSAFVLRRRTPEARRAYLEEHRDEAIANGIPGDLLDLLIGEFEDGEATAECEVCGQEACTTCGRCPGRLCRECDCDRREREDLEDRDDGETEED